MKTRNEVLIQGDPDRIYREAAEIEHWPEILPHYRQVEVLEPGERKRTVRMACVRAFGLLRWPCRWRAEQELDPERRIIRYRHVAGPTKGMWVEWRIEPTPEGVRTTIDHELTMPIPVFGQIYCDRIVGPWFVHAIAGQTLATIQQRVEGKT